MLTDVKVAKLRYESTRDSAKLKIEKHPDRDGLYLAVSPPHKNDPKATYGSKVWRYEYRWPPTTNGKRQTLTYGKYPELSLAEAREKHLEARKAISNGANPAESKQIQKRALLTALGNTYESIAAKWFENENAGKSKSWSDNNARWLKEINKKIGHKAIGSVTHNDCYNAVRPLEDQGFAFSAERARQQIAKVFAYAIRKRLHSGGNPARDLTGEIKVPEHKNNAHIKASEIPEFLKSVDASKGAEQTKIASRLLLLTMVRKQELLAAKKSELDLQAAVWEIPAERMKNRITHLVPLSRQAIALFKRQLEIACDGEYLFPNTQRPGKHAGLSTLNVFFDRIGYADKLTPHGLRSVASTELNGCGAFRAEVIERQLSHIERNKIRGAYNKADYLEERKRLMAHWSDFVDRLCDGQPEEKNVIQLQPKAA